MGNDGGSIPKRDDLVKTKRAGTKLDQKTTLRQLWSFCALSKEPLRAPIVSCPLGKLYNKEAVIAYLLSPPSGTKTATASPFSTDSHLVAGHLRSLKDVTTLHLTPNPTLLSQSIEEAESSANAGTTESYPTAPFVCPISLREMNGSVKFVYRRPCGCVLSESSLKEMRKVGGGNEAEGSDTNVCPVTGRRDDLPEEWVTLNPVGAEAEEMKEAWDARKVREKDEKKAAKSQKRKLAPTPPVTADGGMPPPPPPPHSKKPKLSSIPSHPAPSLHAGASVPLLSATLATKLVEQKKTHSAAIASLYAPKDADQNKDKDGRSTWMTRGAFTRYA